jgi:hypothetical protein
MHDPNIIYDIVVLIAVGIQFLSVGFYGVFGKESVLNKIISFLDGSSFMGITYWSFLIMPIIIMTMYLIVVVVNVII